MSMKTLIDILAAAMRDRAHERHVLIPVKLMAKPRKWSIARNDLHGEMRVQSVVQGGVYTEPLLVGATMSGRPVQDQSTLNGNGGIIGLKQLQRAHQLALVRPRIYNQNDGCRMEVELLTPDGWRQLRVNKIHSHAVREILWVARGFGYNTHVAQWFLDAAFNRKTALLGIDWRFQEVDLAFICANHGITHEEMPMVCSLASESYGFLGGLASLTLRARKLCVVDLDGKEPLPARMAELEPGVGRDELAARLPPGTGRSCAVLVYAVHVAPRMPGFLADRDHYWRVDVFDPTWPAAEETATAAVQAPGQQAPAQDNVPFVQL